MGTKLREGYPVNTDSYKMEKSPNEYEIVIRNLQHKADLCNTVESTRAFGGDSWPLSTNSNYLKSKNLSEKNELLKKYRYRAIFIGQTNRIISDCSLSSLRVKTTLLQEREILCGQRIKECAAHLIFHHILLNSWRKRQKTLDNILSENLILNKSVDNLTLQLKVVRLMDCNEKDKLPISEKSVVTLKEEMVQCQNELKKIKSTQKNVNEEKLSLELRIHDKSRDNLKFQNKLEELETENRILEQDIERVGFNRRVQESYLCDLKLEVVDWKRTVRKSSPSDNNWKDKADALESESWEIRSLLDTKDVSISKYEEEIKTLETELFQLEKERKDLEEKVASTSSTLNQYIEEQSENRRKLREIYKKFADIEMQIHLLRGSLEKQWHINTTDRKVMYDYALKNVRNRRFWGNTLYYVLFPLKAIKNFLTRI